MRDADIPRIREELESVSAPWTKADDGSIVNVDDDVVDLATDEVSDFVANAPELISELVNEIERLRQAESNVQRMILRLGARARLDGDATWRKRMAELAEETTGVGIIPKSKNSDTVLTAFNELRKAQLTFRDLLELAKSTNDMWSVKGLSTAVDVVSLQMLEVSALTELPPLQHLWSNNMEPLCGDENAVPLRLDTPEESRAVPVCARCHSKFARLKVAYMKDLALRALADEKVVADESEDAGLSRAENVISEVFS